MVKRTTVDGEFVYLCEICDFGYRDRRTAEECEEFCRTYNGCSLEITSRAVVRPG